VISGRVQLISPWHTWQLVDDWDTGVRVAPGESEQVSFPVRVPAGADTGAWWALVKVAAAGSIHYTAPVEIVVRR
jgi:alpha-mannosidase